MMTPLRSMLVTTALALAASSWSPRVGGQQAPVADAPPPAFVTTRDFVYTTAPFPSVHASTIVETPARTLMVAYFGGAAEGADDVEIWLSRKPAGAAEWVAPVAMTETPNMPTWNPVLFQQGTRTWLYFKVGPSPQEWVGGFRTSDDDGRTWSAVTWLPAGLLGPVRAKPLILRDGTWLFGTSVEAGYRRSTPPVATYQTWASWVERSEDRGASWTRVGPITVPGVQHAVIQPTMWQAANGDVRMLMRSTAQIGRVVSSTSKDQGRTWSPGKATSLPNPNAGIDAVRLTDGRVILIYNHLTEGRNAIHLAVSRDDGDTWSAPIQLEQQTAQLSYPAVIQTADGRLHVTYTWRRERIRHLVIDPRSIATSTPQ